MKVREGAWLGLAWGFRVWEMHLRTPGARGILSELGRLACAHASERHPRQPSTMKEQQAPLYGLVAAHNTSGRARLLCSSTDAAQYGVKTAITRHIRKIQNSNNTELKGDILHIAWPITPLKMCVNPFGTLYLHFAMRSLKG